MGNNGFLIKTLQVRIKLSWPVNFVTLLIKYLVEQKSDVENSNVLGAINIKICMD